MKKIVLTIGISGSGKSTFAHEQWKANPTGVVVVNRDSIRNLLFGFTDQTIQEYYKRPDLNKLEKQVTKYEDTLINDRMQVVRYARALGLKVLQVDYNNF